MNFDEIRETYLAFFEEREHRRMPSASLVPPPDDTSILLTVAGMQPFKPYFLGREQPPAVRAVPTSQRCFRTTDIEEVGKTKRHLTFFEMLGNFSFGDYFKAESIAFGLGALARGLRLRPRADLGHRLRGRRASSALGPDAESIEIWRSLGVPDERIVRLPRSENFWQAGPTGPCGPCSEIYLDRGDRSSAPDDARPGDDTDRFLEYWNHVFMAYELHEDGSLTDLPQRNIDTGLGLERMAVIQQGVRLGLRDRRLRAAGRARRGAVAARATAPTRRPTRAMRIIADHSRGAVNLIADGVVPSNEDRGYVLRRMMRRAIQQGRTLGLEAPCFDRFAERAIELHGRRLPAPRGRARDRPALGPRRGAELRPHARPRHRAARGAGRRRRAARAPRGSTPGTPSSSTTPTAFPTT